MKRERKSLSDRIDASLINKFLSLREDTECIILDLGCGSGRHSMNMIHSNSKIIGVDINLDSIICAKKRFTERAIENHNFLLADALQIPLRNGTVNYLICNAVLQHVADYSKVIQEASRVVKPGGIMVFGLLHKNLFKDMAVFSHALKWPVWIKRIIFSQNLLYSDIDLYKTKDSDTLVQGSLKSLGIEQTFSLNHLKEIFSANGVEVVDYQYLERFFGRLAQRIKYMIRFGRSKKVSALLYLLSSLDAWLPEKMEGNTLFIKAVKK